MFGLAPIVAFLLAQAGTPPFDLPTGSDYVLATVVVGFLMSPIISALNRSSWGAVARAIGAFVWCLVASALLLIAGDQLAGVTMDLRALFGTFLLIFVMAIGLYNFYFRPSGIAAAIERATG